MTRYEITIERRLYIMRLKRDFWKTIALSSWLGGVIPAFLFYIYLTA